MPRPSFDIIRHIIESRFGASRYARRDGPAPTHSLARNTLEEGLIVVYSGHRALRRKSTMCLHGKVTSHTLLVLT